MCTNIDKLSGPLLYAALGRTSLNHCSARFLRLRRAMYLHHSNIVHEKTLSFAESGFWGHVREWLGKLATSNGALAYGRRRHRRLPFVFVDLEDMYDASRQFVLSYDSQLDVKYRRLLKS